jgi:transcriptional regulator with XRE-family HTH domain
METVKAIFNPALLTKARKEAGLSQAQLADRSGVSQSQIANIENGWSGASTKTLAAICHVLNISTSNLFFFEKINDNTDNHLTEYQ